MCFNFSLQPGNLMETCWSSLWNITGIYLGITGMYMFFCSAPKQKPIQSTEKFAK